MLCVTANPTAAYAAWMVGADWEGQLLPITCIAQCSCTKIEEGRELGMSRRQRREGMSSSEDGSLVLGPRAS